MSDPFDIHDILSEFDPLPFPDDLKREAETIKGEKIMSEENNEVAVMAPRNILEYAIEKNLTPEQIEKFWEIQQKIDKSNAIKAYNTAMVQVEANIKKAIKNKFNEQTRSNYADLAAICEMATPIHTKEGIALSFYEGDAKKDGEIRTCVDIIHMDGHTEKRFIDLDIDDKGIKGTSNKTSIHGKGSSFSYGRRYLTCMIFNIPTGDDNDGQAAGKSGTKISEEELANLRALMDETGHGESNPALMKAFLKMFRVESEENIPPEKLKDAISFLERKRKS